MRPSFMMAASLRYFYTSFVVLTALFVTIGHGGNYKCPSACSCLGSMVDCSKQGLTSVPDDLPIWVTILELSFNGIPEITNGTFKELYKLEELDLSNNKLTALNTGVLEGLPKLKSLKLSHNLLAVIPTLPKDSNLTHLIIHHNRISEIQRNAVDHVLRLRTLDLSHNRIRHLRNDTFTQHPTLHQLYLNNNRLETMQVGCLDNVTALQWLRLSKNRLQQLPKNIFARLSQLKYLELNRNRLGVIDGLSFQGLGSLLTLKLRRNNIHTLMDGAFYGLGRLQNLHLDHNNITAVTKGWMYGLETLQQLLLSHNYISKIEDDSWDSCRVLRHFQLSHNEMVAIKETTFADLPALQYLFLDHNHISYISDSAFHQLVALQTLELNNNEISWTIENTKGAFEGLNSVTRLGLNSNRIKSVTKRAFQGLEQLKQLHLADNAISTIQANAFESLTALQELSVNTSSLVCDCQLAWFPEWLRKRNFETSLVATCAHPESLKGQSIFDVALANFKCSDFPLPIIVTEPESQMALKDGNISLECVAASSMDSPMTIEWKKDHIVLPAKFVQNFEQVGEDNVVMFTSRLHIEHVADEDSGDYQCVISNTLGASYSQHAHISVHVFPTFVKTPEDKTVRAGTTARLDCAATGQPPPQISWQKDGGSDFPAARERRMYVKPTDDAFFIVRFRSTDQGVYSCTATNAAGTIMANVTLSVLETPAFVKPMENRETEEGKTTVLECMASGSPKPRVKWLKDGEPLQLTQRHFFTAENQLLIIVETLPTDAGLYTCIMSNTLGTERGTSRLQVISLNGPGNGSDSMSMLDDETTTTGIIIIAVVCCVVGTSLIWVIIIYQTRKKTEEYSSTPTEDTMLAGDMMPSVAHFYSVDKDSASPNIDLSLTTSSFGRPASDVDNGLDSGVGGPGPGRHRNGAIFPSDIDSNGHPNTDHMLDTCQQFHTCQQGAVELPDADQSSCLSSQSTPSSRSGGPLLLHTFQPAASHSHHKGFVSPLRDWDGAMPPTVAVVRAMPHAATGANTNHVFMYAADDDGDDTSAGCSPHMIDRRRTVGDAVYDEDSPTPHQAQLHSSCSRLHHCGGSPPGGSMHTHPPDPDDCRDDASCRPLVPPGGCALQQHSDHRGRYSPTAAPHGGGHSTEVIPDRTLSCAPDAIDSCSLPHSQSDCDASMSGRPQLCAPVT